MNGIKYLVDTNCFVYLLDENPVILPFLNDGWAFSYVTEMELLSKRGMPADEELLTRELLNSCYKVNHSQLLTELAINLRRNYNINFPTPLLLPRLSYCNCP